jgi:hypothetical protein
LPFASNVAGRPSPTIEAAGVPSAWRIASEYWPFGVPLLTLRSTEAVGEALSGVIEILNCFAR